jgi:hypothetical protein
LKPTFCHGDNLRKYNINHFHVSRVPSGHGALDLRREMARDYTKIKARQLYEELWGKIQEGLRTLQGLISYVEKSGV